MTFDEIKQEIHKMVLKPEDAPTIAENIIKEIDVLDKASTASAKKIETLEKRTMDLQNTNIKLYLAQTGTKPDADADADSEDDDEKTVEELEQEFIDMVVNKGGKENGN